MIDATTDRLAAVRERIVENNFASPDTRAGDVLTAVSLDLHRIADGIEALAQAYAGQQLAECLKRIAALEAHHV